MRQCVTLSPSLVILSEAKNLSFAQDKLREESPPLTCTARRRKCYGGILRSLGLDTSPAATLDQQSLATI